MPTPPPTDLAGLLASLSLSSRLDELGGAGTLEGYALLLIESGRPALLTRLRLAGLAAGHASKVASKIAAALRDGSLPQPSAEHRLVEPVPAAAPPPSMGGRASNDPVRELLHAAAGGDVARARQLLKARAEPDAHVAGAQTVLCAAAALGHADCVRLLLEHGAAPDRRQADGCTALLLACRGGHEGTARILLDDGAAATLARPDGSTPLMECAVRGTAGCAAVLLGGRADTEQRMHHGWSALLLAALHARSSVVTLLLGAGAAADAADAYATADTLSFRRFMITYSLILGVSFRHVAGTARLP